MRPKLCIHCSKMKSEFLAAQLELSQGLEPAGIRCKNIFGGSRTV